MSSTRGHTQQQQFQFRGKGIREKHTISITGKWPDPFSCNSRRLCSGPVHALLATGERVQRGLPLSIFNKMLFAGNVMWKCVGKNRCGIPLSTTHSHNTEGAGEQDRHVQSDPLCLSNMHAIYKSHEETMLSKTGRHVN